jgi:predicted RNA binding protein YcfA (HicA-like mRNA interferase family)
VSKRRFPSKEARELIKIAGTIGWVFIGYTGGGHLRLQHSSGAKYTIPATPSDHRGRMASLTDLQRIGGQRLEPKNRKRAS